MNDKIGRTLGTSWQKSLFLMRAVLALLWMSSIFAAPVFPDLECMAQSFVVDSQRLFIEGYEDAFNPSIVRFQGRLLLSFRTRHPITRSTNLIGFVWLDEEFRCLGPAQIIDMPAYYTQQPSFAQDPRLLMVGDELMMVYSNLADLGEFTERRVVVAKLFVEGDQIFIGPEQLIEQFEGQRARLIEKNWPPFDYQGRLLLAYGINPHRIMEPSIGSAYCPTLYETTAPIIWPWGPVRGGGPGLLEGDVYLGFFHSSKEMKTVHSKGEKISHYFIGGYTFSKEPPFELKSISPEPIIAKGFYTPSKEYVTWKPLRAIFPGGHISSEAYIWVVFGKQDHEVWIMKLDKKAFLESLQPL